MAGVLAESFAAVDVVQHAYAAGFVVVVTAVIVVPGNALPLLIAPDNVLVGYSGRYVHRSLVASVGHVGYVRTVAGFVAIVVAFVSPTIVAASVSVATALVH